MRMSSAVLSSAVELQPSTWALWYAPCLITTFLFFDSKYFLTFGIRSIYWIVAAREIVFPFRESKRDKFISGSLNLRLVSINNVLLIIILRNNGY